MLPAGRARSSRGHPWPSVPKPRGALLGAQLGARDLHRTSTVPPPVPPPLALASRPMIEVAGLTKRYGDVPAVDDLTFDVAAGKVTGFLGPNGAGKSTTMRMVLGLDRPTAGIGDRQRPAVCRPVGSAARGRGAARRRVRCTPAAPAGRTCGSAPAATAYPSSRVDAVIEQAGLGAAAGRRVKGYSLGMRQRLGIAAALLGDPQVLLFDEPVNGLDLDGVRWIRALLRGFRRRGAHGAGLQPPDERDAAHRRPGRDHRRRAADRRLRHRRGAARAGRAAGAGAHAPGRRPAPCPDRAAAVAAHAPGRARGHRPGRRPRWATWRTPAAVPLHHLAEVEQSLEHAYLSLTEDSVDYHGHIPEPVAERSRPMSTATVLARSSRAEWSPDLERSLQLDPGPGDHGGRCRHRRADRARRSQRPDGLPVGRHRLGRRTARRRCSRSSGPSRWPS